MDKSLARDTKCMSHECHYVAQVYGKNTQCKGGSRRMICWLDVDVSSWVGNPRRTPILKNHLGMSLTTEVTGPTDPLTLQRPRCSSTKIITEMARLLRWMRPHEIAVLHRNWRPCSTSANRNNMWTYLVANLEFRQNVNTSLGRANKLT